MADAQAHLQTWRTFKQQGIDGEFRLEEGVGSALVGRCNTLLASLEEMLKSASNLEFLSGYGGLPSAQQLQQKFQQKAVGGATHDPDDNAISRIKLHIEI
ncbi:hypothetical protein, partial [Nocardia farcinica]|uniref:hypothetical protein n=1 Tax=Nocardia farcinica TaxID=37329 RepID=UPI002458CE7B